MLEVLQLLELNRCVLPLDCSHNSNNKTPYCVLPDSNNCQRETHGKSRSSEELKKQHMSKVLKKNNTRSFGFVFLVVAQWEFASVRNIGSSEPRRGKMLQKYVTCRTLRSLHNALAEVSTTEFAHACKEILVRV